MKLCDDDYGLEDGRMAYVSCVPCSIMSTCTYCVNLKPVSWTSSLELLLCVQ